MKALIEMLSIQIKCIFPNNQLSGFIEPAWKNVLFRFISFLLSFYLVIGIYMGKPKLQNNSYLYWTPFFVPDAFHTLAQS